MSTLKQVKRSVAVFEGAADVLLEAGYAGQAVARAHYAVFALCEHIAERQKESVLWPKDDSGRPARRYRHSHVPVTVEAIVRKRQARVETGTYFMTAIQAYAEAKQLVLGRMEADYRPYLEISKEAAARRITASRTLCRLLTAQAEHLATTAAQSWRAQIGPQPGTAEGGEPS